MEFQLAMDTLVSAFESLSLTENTPAEVDGGSENGSKSVKAKTKVKKSSKPNAGHRNFQLVVRPNPLLFKLTGISIGCRAHYIQKLWTYVKKHNLQCADDGRMIEPNEDLAALIGSPDKVSGFKMGRWIEDNLKK